MIKDVSYSNSRFYYNQFLFKCDTCRDNGDVTFPAKIALNIDEGNSTLLNLDVYGVYFYQDVLFQGINNSFCYK